MKKTLLILSILTLLGSAAVYGQRTTFTGTVLIYGSGFNTRTVTRMFTLNITGETSDARAKELLNTLQSDGQDALLRAIDNENLGNFALTGQISRPVRAVRIADVDGKKRIRVIFERWLGFGELRGGYRSLDYPFTYLEIFVDPRTNKGDGTFIGAARVRFKNDQVEVEDFGTFPGKLMAVRMSGRRL